ncbi:hypothetical protein [Actinophytocola sp.]|uniref:hypothetical protein n=1 Tax=Actinophytocola sp. TaxID=1872138 RepID=UPI003D6BBF48
MTVREATPDELDELRALLTTAYGLYAAAVPVTALFERYLADLTDVGSAAGRATRLVAVNAAVNAAAHAGPAVGATGGPTNGAIAGTARLYPAGAVEEVPFLPTAPKGNGTQPNHRYVPNGTTPTPGDHKG